MGKQSSVTKILYWTPGRRGLLWWRKLRCPPQGRAKLTSTENEMADNKIEGAASDVMADLAALRADIAKLSATIGELAQNQAAAAGDHVREAVDGARASLGNSASDAEESLRKAGAEVEAVVARNPLIAVLIAAIVGLLFGMSTRDRR